MKQITFFTIALLFLNGYDSFSQVIERTKTEAEVNIEEKFADAQREMLIGKIDKAIAIYEELYKENRTSSGVAFELAKAYSQKNDFYAVEKYAKVAIANDATNPWLLSFYANYLKNNNRPGSAAEYYTKLITLQPKNVENYRLLAQCHMAQNKVNDAIGAYNLQELHLGPSMEIYQARFDLYDKENNLEGALAQIDHLIKKYPKEKAFLKAKARTLTRNNKMAEAMALYQKVLEIDAEDTDANLAMLAKADDTSKPQAYLMALLPIITNQSVDIDAKIKELMPYVRNLDNGNNTEVRSALMELANKLVLTHPTEAKAYALQGDILWNAGDVEGAVDKFEKTIKLNDKNFAIWDQLMLIYHETMEYEKLYQLCNQALDLYPNQASVYYFLSLASSHKNIVTEAISAAEEGSLVCGGNKINLSRIKTAMAKALILKKEYQNAQKNLDEAMSLSENKNGFAYEIQGDLFQAQGQQMKASENWKKSLSLGNKSRALLQKLEAVK